MNQLGSQTIVCTQFITIIVDKIIELTIILCDTMYSQNLKGGWYVHQMCICFRVIILQRSIVFAIEILIAKSKCTDDMKWRQKKTRSIKSHKSLYCHMEWMLRNDIDLSLFSYTIPLSLFQIDQFVIFLSPCFIQCKSNHVLFSLGYYLFFLLTCIYKYNLITICRTCVRELVSAMKMYRNVQFSRF